MAEKPPTDKGGQTHVQANEKLRQEPVRKLTWRECVFALQDDIHALSQMALDLPEQESIDLEGELENLEGNLADLRTDMHAARRTAKAKQRIAGWKREP